jgi:hypothetical protein
MQNFTVYSTDDIIEINVEGLTVSVSPLTYKQKNEIQNLFLNREALEGAVRCMKYAIKDVSGLKNRDGSEFKLKRKNGMLDDKTIDVLLNAQTGTKINLICVSLINGIPDQFLHPETGKPLDGVSFVESGETPEKK